MHHEQRNTTANGDGCISNNRFRSSGVARVKTLSVRHFNLAKDVLLFRFSERIYVLGLDNNEDSKRYVVLVSMFTRKPKQLKFE